LGAGLDGVHYAPTEFPMVVGLDGVGRLPDGARVAFFAPQAPYGGMAEQALVRRGMWLPVPDGIDDVTAAGPGSWPPAATSASSFSSWPAERMP
jgi:NADPH:quinone reductase-like Zn-dependent oxidoreductase